MNELGREKVVVFVPDVVGELSQGEHPSSPHLFMISLILLNLRLLRTIAPQTIKPSPLEDNNFFVLVAKHQAGYE